MRSCAGHVHSHAQVCLPACRLLHCRISGYFLPAAGGLPPDSAVEETEAALADSKRLIEQYHDPAK